MKNIFLICAGILFCSMTRAQNVGIGTTTPLTKLHVSNGSSGNGNTNSNRIATYEAGSSSYIQLLNPTASESGILAGNTTSLIKSGIIFRADSSIDFRTGTNTSRALIDKSGLMGIGNADPKSKLHVTHLAVPNAQFGFGSFSTAIFESGMFGASNIQLMNSSSFDFRMISGTELTAARSAVNFKADSSIGFETGGFSQWMRLDKDGELEVSNRIGIGTSSPQTKLHVTNLIPLSNAQYATPTFTPAIFESGILNTAVIQLMNPSGHDFRISSGTELTSQRNGIIFKADSSLSFETGGVTPWMKLDKAGELEVSNKIGIGTSSPQTKLHVTNLLPLSNAQYATPTFTPAVFESGIFSTAFIQLMNPSTQDFKIISGTDLAAERNGISFESDSSLAFETGGSVQRMRLDKDGELEVTNKIGIGTSSPQTKLHVVNLFPLSNAQYSSSTFTPAIFETGIGGTSVIQLMNPSNSDFRIASGTELLSQRSGIRFDADSSIAFETGGLTQRMSIDKNGLVTIPGNLSVGTSLSAGSLDVNGTASIGTNGTTLTEVIKVTVNKDVSTISAGASGLETFAVTNAQLNSTVYVSPASALSDGLIIAYARVSLAGTVEVKFVNTTASAINPAAMNFFITVIR